MYLVDVGPQYEGERIRKSDFYVEFGGPDVSHKGELVTVKGLDEVEHDKIIVTGPDIKDLPEGSSNSIFIKMDVAGEVLEKDLEAVLERRIHQYINYIEGVFHMAQRYDIWIRIHKNAFKKGLNSLEEVGRILIDLFTAELPVIEKMSVEFVTDPVKVQELLTEALKVYKERDAKVKGLREEDVAEFYGCVLCQSFAPTHVCIITPERISLCGAINWFDGRAATKIDPEGAQFAVPKGNLIDEKGISYDNVNKVVAERSLGETTRFSLHSALSYPHTSCGCFEAIVFYIPEVDGFGIVSRDFVGATVIGNPFSTLAGMSSGGKQNEGYVGIGVQYLTSPKFLIADGGFSRVAWMTSTLKELARENVSEDLLAKIATEKDVQNVDELTEFMKNVGRL
ncbi:acetyl-CoA decarbonylase/synthase, CODH/ACS complex subunit beta [Candidatus Hakubella thermalkaliphila]|uniref:CO-methylating acetyl-CoA synthase n=3 Tax=Candidatus Hakubella thermalkaliphila TaxID=2754717 RepID=A0A6V8PK02_9ACTN|nr:CO dehydrogenase/CO-methylating acetyl-CoA synthase complex subunit beta [Candidatus Hakubella thermalkaliphila]GFP19220.1 acetyl-CoA decarbonylase/synthase, CODH/ACS complex subunit beta [Candidatus Hakubella thermalkaliphila]GFP22610.1 acetyl-CoA decarbonylase/synthase, CODH/ACS complex subunit beta [Candidatus Hakubella thermalkaliphila]GFP31306.1 acetyl-CoA decarbonylase/synthase, CODH/ACS complex subunit beta [Candidatus Hakubella thermalkaliphila]GFP42871.1 acetyl-CoA decarbonylase/syn